MNKIIIKDASFLCNIGVTRQERSKKQKILIDVELFFSVGHTVNYSQVYALIKSIVKEKEYKLIETMAENVAEEVLKKFPIKKIVVRIKKPSALADRNVRYVAVEIVRER
jgi:dihydroneopterin aldolase